MNEKFAVPLAWDNLIDRHIVYPEEAEKHRDYFCPNCENRIRVRGGPKTRDHFYHLPPNDSRICKPESVYHAVAKQLLAEWIEAGRPIKVMDDCPRCGTPREYRLPPGPTKIEQHVGIFRGDLVYLDDHGKVKAAIEIRYAHAVDDRKAKELSKPWVEFNALEVLEQRDAEVFCLHSLAFGGGWGPKRCTHCKDIEFFPTRDGQTLAGCPRFSPRMLGFAQEHCHSLGRKHSQPCRFHVLCDMDHIHCTATTETLNASAAETETIIERFRDLYKQKEDERCAQQSRSEQKRHHPEPAASSVARRETIRPEAFSQRSVGRDVWYVRCPEIDAQGSVFISVYLAECDECPHHERKEDGAYCGWASERIKGFPFRAKEWRR